MYSAGIYLLQSLADNSPRQVVHQQGPLFDLEETGGSPWSHVGFLGSDSQTHTPRLLEALRASPMLPCVRVQLIKIMLEDPTQRRVGKAFIPHGNDVCSYGPPQRPGFLGNSLRGLWVTGSGPPLRTCNVADLLQSRRLSRDSTGAAAMLEPPSNYACVYK